MREVRNERELLEVIGSYRKSSESSNVLQFYTEPRRGGIKRGGR